MKPEYFEYLRELAERLRHVPATYNVDGGDVDMLLEIATAVENETEYEGFPP